MSDEAGAITVRSVWRLTWPMIVSNSSTPLLGLVDTAVIGHAGGPALLGAVAVGSLVFVFVYWGFGFLRMATTGLTAQAMGAGDERAVVSSLGRAMGLAILLGLFLAILRAPIENAALGLLGASAEVEGLARGYFQIRIWSAPATLTTFAISGWLIGLQRTRSALAVQLWLNGSNIVLDVLFVRGLGWGVEGVAIGTLCAEWSALLPGGWLVWRRLSGSPELTAGLSPARLFELGPLRRAVGVGADIFVRTLLLISAFAWFTAQGARAGDATLAANHVLLQFLAFSAFFLDGFAFSTEALVGNAGGAGRVDSLRSAVRTSTGLAVFTAAVLSGLIAVFGPLAIEVLTDVEGVRAEARRHLGWAALNPILAVWCFQLDGIFIGATRTADMRNMMAISFGIYLGSWALLAPSFGNHGLWAAFSLFFVVRGVTLGVRYPSLVREVGGRSALG